MSAHVGESIGVIVRVIDRRRQTVDEAVLRQAVADCVVGVVIILACVVIVRGGSR